MPYSRVDVNSSSFPRHNGHRAWHYYAKTIEDAAIEDLFWRIVQTSPDVAADIVKFVWPSAHRVSDEMIIPQNLHISLFPESCGAYTRFGYGGLYPLRGDATDLNRINEGVDASKFVNRGYYFAPLIANKRGWRSQDVVGNLLPHMKMKLTSQKRYLFHKKTVHQQILIQNQDEEKIKQITENSYHSRYGFKFNHIYWYRTENSSISFCVVYLHNESWGIIKFPVTAWVGESCSSREVVYDMLNIAPPYPLYDLDLLVGDKELPYVLICDSEATVDQIKHEHGWVQRLIPITTYSVMDGTDWSKLRTRIPIILPNNTAAHCIEAFRLYETLVQLGYKPLFLKRQKGGGLGSREFIQDVNSLAFHGSECSLPEFAEHCQREFGVKPPDGVLPKAVPIPFLSEPAIAPEILMDGLLDTWEQMMIHAWRGVGKSLFALLLALCFASGKSALNGRVCPSRKHHVLLLDGEMSGHNLRKRARGLCCGHELPLDAMDAVKVRSPILEGKDLNLESDAGFAKLEPDMMAADTIIVDSVFKFFPTAMNSEFAGAEKMLGFLDWCRRQGKTLILIDHEGKGRGTSFGTMAKEIGLDVVLRLCKAKSGNWIQALVQKARDHAEPTEAYLEMRIEASEKGENIAFQVRNEHKVVSAHRGDGEADTGSSVEKALSIDEAITKYVCEHPDAPQKEIADALIEMGYAKRSTIQARIKTLSEAGKLPDWKNRPETHKVGEPPAPEVDEK